MIAPDHKLGLVATNDGEAAADDDYNVWYDNGGDDDDVDDDVDDVDDVDDDDDDDDVGDYCQREPAAFHLSFPTSICGSLNTAIRQGITPMKFLHLEVFKST